ncbi:MAG: hypothetical protein FWE67_04915 [Planctomycetaceae bacterium]|nr:hypothetical protein [Planctomycetaceae bacterium]
MTQSRFLTLFVFLCAAIFVSGAAAQDVVRSKKLIQLGWDIPDTAYLKEHHEEMQQTTPFDGVMVSLETTAPDGKKYGSRGVMNADPWDPAWFVTAIDDLKACRWTTFTDNFILFNFSPGNLDWDNDKGWENFCGKAAICSQIAKKTGLKGLCIDFEPYGKTVFKYAAESGKSFDEMKQLVRKRGQQWMKAIAAEYPDMVMFTLFIGYVNIHAGYDSQPDDILKTLHYGLLPSFFNGMLDAIPPKMEIVDGTEMGYYLNGIDEFSRLSLALQSIGGPAIRLVAPENHEKYIRQMRVGFGFYLDMHTNPEGNQYYRGPKEGGTRLDRLEENLAAALKTTDEYVWIYGEQRYWWKPRAGTRVKDEHWEAALPGMTQTLHFTKSPREAAKLTLGALQKENRIVNLVKNPDFSESIPAKSRVGDTVVDIKVPAEWGSWQDKPLGVFSWEDGSAKASGVKWGCFLQSFKPVNSGEYYYISIDSKQQGTGEIGMRVRWQNAESKYVREAEDKGFAFKKDTERLVNHPLADGLQRAEGVFRVPEGVAVIQIQAGVRDQTTADDAVWFDNAVLIRLR